MTALFSTPVRSTDTDERYTPTWVFDGMGAAFDLDPASPVGGGDNVPAHTRYTVKEDGLARPWVGLVWLNPPFSNARPWVERFIAHDNGVFLGPFASARWRRQLLEAADFVWLVDDFAFDAPTHAGKRSSMPLVFTAQGGMASMMLARLARSGRHPGTIVEVKE